MLVRVFAASVYVCMQHGCRSSEAKFPFSAQNVREDVNGRCGGGGKQRCRLRMKWCRLKDYGEVLLERCVRLLNRQMGIESEPGGSLMVGQVEEGPVRTLECPYT